MSACFLDTSALAKRYHQEVGTPYIDSLINGTNDLFLSRLTVTELHSVFATKCRTGQIGEPAFRGAVARFLAEVRQQIFFVLDFQEVHFREAERLLVTYGSTQSLRTLDALQLASANVLRAAHRIDSLITADKRLLAVALLEAHTVIDPESASVP